MTRIRMLALMAVAAMLLIFPAVVLGQQIPPHLTAVTASVDGAPAPDGTVVTAWIGSPTESLGLSRVSVMANPGLVYGLTWLRRWSAVAIDVSPTRRIRSFHRPGMPSPNAPA